MNVVPLNTSTVHCCCCPKVALTQDCLSKNLNLPAVSLQPILASPLQRPGLSSQLFSWMPLQSVPKAFKSKGHCQKLLEAIS